MTMTYDELSLLVSQGNVVCISGLLHREYDAERRIHAFVSTESTKIVVKPTNPAITQARLRLETWITRFVRSTERDERANHELNFDV